MDVPQSIIDQGLLPLGVGLIGWLAKSLYDKWRNRKKDSYPFVRLLMDINYNFLPISDPNFDKKIRLATLLLRSGKKEFIQLIPETNFKISHLSKYEKDSVELKMMERALLMQKQIEIFLMRPISIQSECPVNKIKIINSLLTRSYTKHEGHHKIDIYRAYTPKILFSVWLSNSDIEDIANELGAPVQNLKQDLRIPGLRSASIFTKNQLLELVITKMIYEIHRINSEHGFDLEIKHWESIMMYDIGFD